MNTYTKAIEVSVAPFAGKVLTAKEITAVTVAAYPELAAKVSSFNISDHAPSGKQANQYADYLFERSGSGYKVLASDAIVRRPKSSGRGNRGVSLTDALASALAKLQTAPDHIAEANAAQALEDAELEAATAPDAE